MNAGVVVGTLLELLTAERVAAIVVVGAMQDHAHLLRLAGRVACRGGAGLRESLGCTSGRTEQAERQSSGDDGVTECTIHVIPFVVPEKPLPPGRHTVADSLHFCVEGLGGTRGSSEN